MVKMNKKIKNYFFHHKILRLIKTVNLNSSKDIKNFKKFLKNKK